MKILYFGTICNIHNYDEMLNDCKLKPSVASIIFESALLTGFKENQVQIELISFPPIPMFPQSKHVFFGGQTEELECGYSCKWLRTFNIPILKQITRKLDARKIMRQWVKNSRNEGVIFTYSIPPFLVDEIIKTAKRYNIKIFAIVPDLLSNMYMYDSSKSIFFKIKQHYIKSAQNLQDGYDGYIYLTEAMKNVVAPKKPYMVMEAIANVSNVKIANMQRLSNVRSIMYAGGLHEIYGIINLIDAFEMLNDDNIELWLFGNGTAVEKIQKRCKENSRIKYFGNVSHDIILEKEREATILVNPRSPNEKFTEYSFPSKTVEYMLSGTPLLTTKLKGIPNQYFDFVFTADDNSPEALKISLEKIFSISQEDLILFGEKAQHFIIEEKNAKFQTQRIVDFMNEVSNGIFNKD